jgi:hypothetical protein
LYQKQRVSRQRFPPTVALFLINDEATFAAACLSNGWASSVATKVSKVTMHPISEDDNTNASGILAREITWGFGLIRHL